MERLTIKNSDGTVSQPLDLRWSDALYRLAAYEDTGLEPEEIVEMKDALSEIRKDVDGIYANQNFVQMLKNRGVDVDVGLRHMQELINAQQEAEKNEPLTLDELRQMDGEPVYMVDLTGGTLWDQWIIFKTHTDYGFIPRGGGWFGAENYGKTWLAYRHKPKGEIEKNGITIAQKSEEIRKGRKSS